MPSRYGEDRDGEVQAHEKGQRKRRADWEPCPHCPKKQPGESHKAGCPARRVKRQRRQDVGGAIKALFRGLF